MQLNDKEIHKLFIECVRYSLTRHSYAPSECADLIRSRWDEIPEKTRVIIGRDLNEAIEDDNRTKTTHKWPTDIYQTWYNLQDFMGEKYKPKPWRSLDDVMQDYSAPIYIDREELEDEEEIDIPTDVSMKLDNEAGLLLDDED